MPKGIPLTDEELNRRRKEICYACIPLFLEKGFHETSMREVAEAAGVGKSTLYDYFPSKDEIMIFYFESALQMITERAREIIQGNSSVRDKLSKIMEMHMGYLVENKHFFLRLSMEAQRLSAESQEKIQVERHAYQDMLCALIEEGINQGEFRAIPPLFATRSIFSLLSTAVFTTRPTGSPEEMLAQALAIFFQGIQA
jgi:AcrR family transcriptional regulator